MTHLIRVGRWLCLALLCLPISVQAEKVIHNIVVFGDSLSDTGNTTHLLKSLRQEESPAYLVKPLKVFVINKMTEFAYDYYVPQIVLDAGIGVVNEFFDLELAPLLANVIGKVRQVPILPGEPYWQNHFSNGRVWDEYLAPMLDIDREDMRYFSVQDFGGSWAVTYDYQLTVWNLIRHPLLTLKTLVVGKLIPPSLGLTIQAYLLMNESLDEKTVYFVFTGANDYLNVLLFEDNYNPAIMSAYIDNVLEGISYGVHKLIKAGAKHVVVMGLPDIGYTPKFVNTMDQPVISAAIKLHNERLAARIAAWKQEFPDADILHIEIEPFLQKALNNPADYGISNLTKACIDVKFPMFGTLAQSHFAKNYVLQYAHVLNYKDKSFSPGEKNFHVCGSPKSYLFWDEIHPTTKAHHFLAYEICEVMKVNGYQTNCQKPSNA